MNLARAFRLINHAHADAVFHAVAGIVAFQLSGDFAAAARGNFIEIYQGSVADQLRHIVCNFHAVVLHWITRSGLCDQISRFEAWLIVRGRRAQKKQKSKE
jgi:hypothetical protein